MQAMPGVHTDLVPHIFQSIFIIVLGDQFAIDIRRFIQILHSVGTIHARCNGFNYLLCDLDIDAALVERTYDARVFLPLQLSLSCLLAAQEEGALLPWRSVFPSLLHVYS